jgi:DNA-binding transcriptional ArsR family regulator
MTSNQPSRGDRMLGDADEDGRLQVRDAASMRAVAHPARIAALNHLMHTGPATATELGEIAGLTPSAMSYHLRQLERAGMIETAPGRGDGRERVWQTQDKGWSAELRDDGSDEGRAASLQLLDAVLTVQDIDTRAWMASSTNPEWLDDGVFIDTTIIATTDELFEIGRQLSELTKPLSRQLREGSAPPDAAEVRIMFRGFRRMTGGPRQKPQ